MSAVVTPLRNLNRVSLLWASPDRAEELSLLHEKLFDPPWSQKSIEDMLAHPASTSLIAVTGDPKVTIGFIIGQLAADEAEILSIGVIREWQRFGVGRKLLEGLIRASTRGEAKRLFLEVAEDNVAAIRLYARLGFKEFGRRKDYYRRLDGVTSDALTLSLDL